MYEYSPRFMPGEAITCRAAGNILPGQLVKITADKRVVDVAGAADAKTVIGVSAGTYGQGDDCAVWIGGQVHRLTAAGKIDAGQRVKLAADGKIEAEAAENGIGICISGAAESGSKAEVILFR